MAGTGAGGLEAHHLAGVHAIGKSSLHDLCPDRTLIERPAAAAETVFDKILPPDVADLPRREKAVYLAEAVGEDRAAAPAEPHDVEYLCRFTAHGLASTPSQLALGNVPKSLQELFVGVAQTEEEQQRQVNHAEDTTHGEESQYRR